MKTLKITIITILVVGIFGAIIFGIQVTQTPAEVKAAENQFTAKIEQEIELLKTKPDNKFCGNFYNEIAFDINDFYNQGRFGKNQLENDEWKENLEKNLYAAYAEKFIKQATTVFHGSDWTSENLNFIQSEINKLKKSSLLIPGSPVDKDFSTIQATLNKYHEIESFILFCKSFNFLETDLSARFPLDDVQSKIFLATSLLKNNLENELVNNCTKLHNGLKEIPQYLFSAQVDYLEHKINNWSGLYSNYNSQSDYSNNLYKPLKAEIEALDNDIYNVSNFDSEYNRLLQKWSDDNTKAYKHKY